MQHLTLVEINPSLPPESVIIWLHGLGADGNDFLSVVPVLNQLTKLNLRFVFPNAPLLPVTINNGMVMPAWYDICHKNIHEQADRVGILRSVTQIHHLIEAEENRGMPVEKIFLAGFSQGAVIALTAGLMFPRPLAGIIALSGYLPYAAATLQSSKQPLNLPLMLAHGSQDSIVPVVLGQMAYQALEENGFKVDWHTYPIAHTVNETEIHAIAQWLIKIIALKH